MPPPLKVPDSASDATVSVPDSDIVAPLATLTAALSIKRSGAVSISVAALLTATTPEASVPTTVSVPASTCVRPV